MTLAAETSGSLESKASWTPAGFWAFFAVCLAVYAILAYLHLNYISTFFGYEGFQGRIDYQNVVFSILILFVSCFFASLSSDFIMNVLAITIYQAFIASLVLFSFGNRDAQFMIVTLVGFLVIFLIPNVLSFPGFTGRRLSMNSCMIIILVIAACYFSALIMLGGLKYINFSFSEVYQYRRDAGANLPAIFGYISPPIGKVLVPIATIISLYQRNWPLFILCIFMSIMVFALTAHKAPAMLSIVAALIFYINTRTSKMYVGLGIFTIAILVLAAFLFARAGTNTYSESFYTAALIAKRTMLLPAQVNAYYIEFFSENPQIFWAGSKFTFGLLEQTYDTRAPLVIGDYFFRSTSMSANTGWIGSGFAHAGMAGVLFYSVLIGLLIAFLAATARRLGNPFVVAVSFPSVSAILLSTDPSTALITHGLWALILFLLFIDAPDSAAAQDDAQTQPAA